MQAMELLDRRTVAVAVVAFVLIVGIHWFGKEYLFLSTASPAVEMPSQTAGALSPLAAACDLETVYTSLEIALRQPERVCALNLSQHRLSELPGTIGSLVRLRALTVNGNQLQQLPAEIGWLRELQELNVSDNRLTALPAHIGWLRELRVLNIRNNQLTTIPDEIGWLQKLERLDVHGNPLPTAEIDKARRYLPNTSIITN